MNKKNILPDLILRKLNQRKNAQKLQVNHPNSIVESQFVHIGGIDQWITIRGEDRNNPVLLFIHGGPASPYSIFNPLLRQWEKYFTIVQWDQRGAGKTFRKNFRTGHGTITFDRLSEDGIELTRYLCDRLGHRKIILIGSSAGSLIAMKMAQRCPDLFHAYVGTDQNAPDPEHVSYQLALDAFHASGLKKGVRLIERMGPDSSRWSRHDFDQLSRILVKATTTVPNMIMDLILPSMLSSPDHTMGDLIDIFKGMHLSLDHLYEELINFDFSKLGTKFELPFFVFQGDSDIITPTATAKAFYDEIDAPQKQFIQIKSAGHLACFARPDQFFIELIERVRTIAIALAPSSL
ncbi:alpha/beta fold hydrolase [Paenibacillus sp. SN-8-1]|uniref:alpha/beta fold hydrolase n=1 Tax=Paenibacillus sp. SN-8-1 TaxID=3435409 RepID=UPI003D9A30BD